MARQIQTEIATLIRSGKTVMITKTKLATEGGRQLVSVGRYRTATDTSRRYAVITNADCREFLSAITAAKAFIEFVGRDRAAEAADRCH